MLPPKIRIDDGIATSATEPEKYRVASLEKAGLPFTCIWLLKLTMGTADSEMRGTVVLNNNWRGNMLMNCQRPNGCHQRHRVLMMVSAWLRHGGIAYSRRRRAVLISKSKTMVVSAALAQGRQLKV